MKIIFFLAVTLALGACAPMNQEPTTEASRVDRIVFAQNSRMGSVCRTMAPSSNPDITLEELFEKCACANKHFVDNADGRVVVWAIRNNDDWWDKPMPPWAERRMNFESLVRGAFHACGLKTVR